MYILNAYRGRKLIQTLHYNNIGIEMNADIAFHTSFGFKVVITFQDVD